jgi:hypothetical protein
MSQTQRVEMWTAMATEASALGQDYVANLGLRPTDRARGLDMRMSAVRGRVRGPDFRALPYPAWEGGRQFLWLAGVLIDDERPTAERIEIVDDLVVCAERLIQTLSHTSARPRADLDD